MPAVTSETAIANLALQKLGEDRIQDINDPEKRAREMKLALPVARQGLLRLHSFNFAIDRVELSQLLTPPLSEWAFAYALPSDFVRALNVNMDNESTLTERYVIEGTSLLCDSDSPLLLRYIKDETDVTKYDSLFVEALACKLAMKTCSILTGSDQKAEAALKEYAGLSLPAAEAANSRDVDEREPWHYRRSRYVNSRRTSPLG